MFLSTAIVVILGIILILYRVIAGPTIYDRILAVNLIGTKIVILIVLIGFIYERPDFMDIALVYAIINSISTFAVAKYIEKGRLG